MSVKNYLEPWVGRSVVAVSMDEENLNLFLEDGCKIRIYDDGQFCCEARYMRTDDDVTSLTILEPSMIIQVCVSGRSKDDDIRFCARAWKQEMFQNAVLVTRQALTSAEFI